MFRKIKLTPFFLAIILAATAPVYAGVITLIDPGTDDRLQSITGLEIDGTTYDIAFTYGGSYNDLPSGNITFTTAAAAELASDVINDFINGQTITPVSGATAIYMIPISTAPTTVSLFFNNSTTGVYNFSHPFSVQTRDRTITYVPGDAFATFSEAAAVPEPSTFALLGMGAIGLIGYRRRKRKQAA